VWTHVTLRVIALVLLAQTASAEVVRVEIQRREDAGTHQRLTGRVFFEVDPSLPANQAIADIALAPRNGRGRVEFSSNLLFYVPKDAARARGTVFLEIMNRGREQSLGLMGEEFALEQGFTVAFLGWQFDVTDGLGLQAPVAPGDGLVRASLVVTATPPRVAAARLPYCAAAGAAADARVSYRTRIDAEARPLPADSWRFDPDGCVVEMVTSGAGLYEAVYRASGSPVAPDSGSLPSGTSRRTSSTAAMARRCARTRRWSAASSGSATRRAGASCASSCATASTRTSAGAPPSTA
jgi:hypothetical protein